MRSKRSVGHFEKWSRGKVERATRWPPVARARLLSRVARESIAILAAHANSRAVDTRGGERLSFARVAAARKTRDPLLCTKMTRPLAFGARKTATSWGYALFFAVFATLLTAVAAGESLGRESATRGFARARWRARFDSPQLALSTTTTRGFLISLLPAPSSPFDRLDRAVLLRRVPQR
jgi:hypothetical protein